MVRKHWVGLALAAMAGLALAAAPTYAAKKDKTDAGSSKQTKITLPDAADKAIKEAFPAAVVGETKIEVESGVLLYAVTIADGIATKTVDVSAEGVIAKVKTPVADVKDVPEAVVKAIDKTAEGGIVVRYKKVDLRAQVKEEGGSSKLVKLQFAKTVYEADLMKGNQVGSVEVGLDGAVIQPVKWESVPAPATPAKKKGKKNQ